MGKEKVEGEEKFGWRRKEKRKSIKERGRNQKWKGKIERKEIRNDWNRIKKRREKKRKKNKWKKTGK